MFSNEVSMNKHKGFTLIELVIVVVILGFLAVTAIPKFIDLTDQAKQANIEGMAGGFATGISLVRAQWEAEGRPENTSNQNLVDYDGTTIYLTVEGTGIRPGYPISTTATADINDVDCIALWQAILQQPPGITDTIADLNGTNGSNFDYFASDNGGGAGTTCRYYLKESLNKSNAGAYQNPGNSTTIGNSFTYQPADSSVVVYVNN